MSVPQITLFNTMASSLTSVMQDIQQTETELATGKVVNQPSDNPSAYAQEGLMTANLSAISNDLTLAARVKARLAGADSALAQVQNALNSAITTATQGADGSISTTQMQSLAQSVQGLLSQVVTSANLQELGSYVFAGNNSLTQPFSPTGTYLGNAATNSATFSTGAVVQENFDGQSIFGNSTSGAIGALTSLSSALSAGNKSAVSATLPVLQSALSSLATTRSKIGSQTDTLQNMVTNLNSQSTSIQAASSSLVGVNVAQAAAHVQEVLLQQGALVSLSSDLAKIPLVNVLA